MASLSGATIASTFKSLLKLAGNTDDLASGGSTAIQVMTGDGENTAIYLNTDRVGIVENTPGASLSVGGSSNTLVTDGTTAVSVLGVNVNMSAAGAYAVGIKNGDASGDGLIIQAGDNSDDFALRVEDYNSGNDLFVVRGDGNVGIGTVVPSGEFEIASGASAAPTVTISNHFNDANGPVLSFRKERGGTIGTAGTVPSVNDYLGSLRWYASDSNSWELTAIIAAQADHSTWSNNNVPSKLVFFTTPDGSVTPVERLTIKSEGNVGIGQDTPSSTANVAGDPRALLDIKQTADDAESIRFSSYNNDSLFNFIYSSFSGTLDASSMQFYVVGGASDVPERVMTLRGEKVGIGTAAPSALLHALKDDEDSTIRVQATSLADAEGAYMVCDAEGNSATRIAYFGVHYNSGATTNAPCGFTRMDASDGTTSYFWVDDGDRLMGSTTLSHIGTTSGVVQGAGATSSDERKKNIDSGDFPYGLDKINALEPVQFVYKNDVDKINRLGFIAQASQPIIPEIVQDSKQCVDGYSWEYDEDGKETEQVPNSNDPDTELYMDYLQIIPVLVKAVQELTAKVEALENNNQQGESSNEQEESGSGGDASSESSGEDSGGVEADSSDSSDSASGASEASESSSDDGDQSSGSSGSDSSDDSEGGSGGDDSGGSEDESSGDGKSVEPSDNWTKDELKEYMDANDIGYNSGDTKQDLLDKINLAGESPDED